MKKEYLIIFIVLLVAIVGGFALKVNKSGNEDVTQETQVIENEGEVEKNTVTYTDSGFAPDSFVVTAGTTVTFIDQSDNTMWVGSDPHPVHTDHSAFDQRQTGNSYSFTFTETGTYNYHNHMFPTHTGVVIVE